MSSGLTCSKCFARLKTCPVCRGSRRHNCKTCNSTGVVCPSHGAFHGRG